LGQRVRRNYLGGGDDNTPSKKNRRTNAKNKRGPYQKRSNRPKKRKFRPKTARKKGFGVTRYPKFAPIVVMIVRPQKPAAPFISLTRKKVNKRTRQKSLKTNKRDNRRESMI